MIIPKGQIISFTRIQMGLSMRGLARITKLNIGTISNIESKESPVMPKTAKLVSDALERPIEELFTINYKNPA